VRKTQEEAKRLATEEAARNNAQELGRLEAKATRRVRKEAETVSVPPRPRAALPCLARRGRLRIDATDLLLFGVRRPATMRQPPIHLQPHRRRLPSRLLQRLRRAKKRLTGVTPSFA